MLFLVLRTTKKTGSNLEINDTGGAKDDKNHDGVGRAKVWKTLCPYVPGTCLVHGKFSRKIQMFKVINGTPDIFQKICTDLRLHHTIVLSMWGMRADYGDSEEVRIHQESVVFIHNALLFGFAFSCISAGLPKTEANWQSVIQDLKTIEHLIQSMHMDATLYTESDAHPNCKVTALQCFLLELRVILHESKNAAIYEIIENLTMLADRNLSSIENKTELGCKECEELEEKSIKEFLKSFVHIVQMFNTS
ncbi:hypothetical protein MJT46_013851 [Ovis ammon polii x Ovis aries]|nr:hypothetical protein MJT46_013851 [Ovis ammon polii x Ovis aries]